MVLSMLIFFGL